MANKKLSDVWLALIALIFFTGAFSIIISSFDMQFSNNEGYGTVINNSYVNASSSYQSSDQVLQQNLLNGSSFSIAEQQQIDTRGYASTSIINKESPNTFINFIKLSAKYMMLHPLIISTIITIIISVISLLFIRAFIERQI